MFVQASRPLSPARATPDQATLTLLADKRRRSSTRLRNRSSRIGLFALASERQQISQSKPAPRRMQHSQPRNTVRRMQQRPCQRQRIQHLRQLIERIEIDGAIGKRSIAIIPLELCNHRREMASSRGQAPQCARA